MKSQCSTRLFKNSFLEKLTHVHPIIPLLLWLPVLCFFVFRAATTHELSPSQLLYGFVVGVCLWSILEYSLHRFLFHYEAKSEWGKRLVFLFHGIHHHEPMDKTRLVMPPAVSVILALIVYHLLGWSIALNWVDIVFAGIVGGYLIYDYIHYSCHHFKMDLPFLRAIKRNHLIHHFQDPHSKWGVSSPLWDFCFSSYKSQSHGSQSRRYQKSA